ncbi:MAG: FliG C-terminal domain-containing protein [Candidatus Neomarinimicrobiota bacterium]|nr:FliG C-terminal domain-containing protein [Candidatus Neomarinimicrobiota bacterium]
MINDYHMLSGLQKVAILFSVVGESLAMSLVKGLSKTEIRKIRSTSRSMGTVSFVVKKRVMEEFYFGFLSEQIDDDKSDEGPIQPFEFLTNLNDEQLIALLDKEETPVIAMILAQLEPDKKMLILNKLEPTLKGEVLIELGSLGDIPLEGIIEVGARLKEKSTYLPRTAEFSRGGAKEIADMLGDMSSKEQERYMQTLQNEDPDLYAAVKMFFLTFDDIIEKFPSDVQRTLFVGFDLGKLAYAVKGLDQEVIDGIIETQPAKRQAMFEPIEGPVTKREVDEARKEIVAAAKELEKSGELNIEDILSGGEMVE